VKRCKALLLLGCCWISLFSFRSFLPFGKVSGTTPLADGTLTCYTRHLYLISYANFVYSWISSEDSYRECVVYKREQWDGLGLRWVVAPQKKYIIIVIILKLTDNLLSLLLLWIFVSKPFSSHESCNYGDLLQRLKLHTLPVRMYCLDAVCYIVYTALNKLSVPAGQHLTLCSRM
jgi:hypothetical protein